MPANVRGSDSVTTEPSQDARPEAEPASIFISYARADQAFVRRLVAALEARGRQPWVDWEDIPKAADWWADIQVAITSSDAVVFVLTPDSAGSKVCREELDHAYVSAKRIVPIHLSPTSPAAIPDSVRRRNWIDFQAEDAFDSALDELIAAVDTDLEWVATHTRLAVRAREWDVAGQEASRLLRGRELEAGEAWLAGAAEHAEPRPSEVQSAYLLASRRAATRSQRSRMTAAIGAVVVSATLAGVAVLQSLEAARERDNAVVQQGIAETERTEARRQRDVAAAEAQRNLARSLAAQAANDTHSLDLSLLLAVEGVTLDDSPETRAGLFTALSRSSHAPRFLHGLAGSAYATAADPAGRWFAAGDDDGVVVWDASTGQITTRIALDGVHGPFISALATATDGRRLAFTSPNGDVVVLDADAEFREIERFDGSEVSAIALADGGSIALGMDDGSIRLSSGVRAGADRVIKHGADRISAVAFSPDGGRILAAGGQTVRIWDVRSAEPVELGEPVSIGADVTSTAYSPDGKLVGLTTTNPAQPILVLPTNGGPGSVIANVRDPVTVTCSAPGTRIASAGDELVFGNAVFTWRVGEYRLPSSTMRAHRGSVVDVDFGARSTLISAADNGTVIQWNLDALAPYWRSIGQAEVQLQAIEASADGSVVAGLSTGADVVGLYDGSTANLIETIPAGGATALALSADGHLLAMATDAEVRVVDRDGTQISDFVPSDGEVIDDIAFNASGRTLAVHSYTYAVGPFTASPSDGKLSTFDVETGTRLAPPIGAGTAVSGLTFTADGLAIRAVDDDAAIVTWSLVDGSGTSVPLDLGHDMHALALDPSGVLVLAATETQGFLFDTRIRGGLQLGMADGFVAAAAFDGAGELVTVGSIVPAISQVDVTVEAWVAEACAIANRTLTPAEVERYIGSGVAAVGCPTRAPIGG